MGNGSDDWMKAGVMCTRGAIVALSSGAIVGAGYGFLTESIDDEVPINKLIKRIGWRSLGGGIFTVGLYMWAPIWLRALWIPSMENK